MPELDEPDDGAPRGNQVFATTHWSVVLAARGGGSSQAAEALEKLCGTYWYPLYAYIRRRGFASHEAEDLVQSFFVHLIERDSLRGIGKEKGRFRSFLLASLNYFLADIRDRQHSQKRGGGREILSFDAQSAEDRYRLEPVDDRSPEKIFERRWATTLLDLVLARLRQEFADAGKEKLFERLQMFLVVGEGEQSYAELGREIGLREDAVKKAIQRLRKRYHRLFREEIAHTVSTPAEVDEELRHLCAVMSL